MTALLRFLVEQELISEEDAEALETGASKRELLGHLLLRKRVLTIRQLMRALALQADEPQMRVGEIVVREGYATSEDVDRALEEQRTSRRTALELLFESRRLAPETLIAAISLFLERHGQALAA